jgi:hypothetical protein
LARARWTLREVGAHLVTESPPRAFIASLQDCDQADAHDYWEPRIPPSLADDPDWMSRLCFPQYPYRRARCCRLLPEFCIKKPTN